MLKLAICLCLPFCLLTDVFWEKDYDAALEKAAEEGKPVFIAVNKKGSFTSQRLVDRTCLGGRIVVLCQNTVNIFCADYVMRKEDKVWIVSAIYFRVPYGLI